MFLIAILKDDIELRIVREKDRFVRLAVDSLIATTQEVRNPILKCVTASHSVIKVPATDFASLSNLIVEKMAESVYGQT